MKYNFQEWEKTALIEARRLLLTVAENGDVVFDGSGGGLQGVTGMSEEAQRIAGEIEKLLGY